MKGLIQKSGYIKPGNGGGHYAEYIATRDGVELMEPTAGGGYLEYIAERPRSHGLFSASGAADLEQTMEEINAHAGPVWTFIYSLKREDAARLDYENGESWRRLLLAHQVELAAAMKIPPSSFRWCAAFHDEKHHPHIHMMVWSTDPKQGYLTEKGIEQMRSKLSNDIFQDELLSLYQEKNLSYQQVRDTAMEAMGRLIREMKSGLCDSPVIAGQMESLAEMLSEVKGKKVYGYLKKPVKVQVDAIVDELARLPEVAECYEHWNRLRDELERYYITAGWLGGDSENAEQAARYCRAVYEAGFSPICPTLYLPLFLNDAVPEEHKSGIDMSRDLLRRSHVLVVCGHTMTEAMKNDIAVAQRLGITATTLEGILTVKGQGRR